MRSSQISLWLCWQAPRRLIGTGPVRDRRGEGPRTAFLTQRQGSDNVGGRSLERASSTKSPRAGTGWQHRRSCTRGTLNEPSHHRVKYRSRFAPSPLGSFGTEGHELRHARCRDSGAQTAGLFEAPALVKGSQDVAQPSPGILDRLEPWRSAMGPESEDAHAAMVVISPHLGDCRPDDIHGNRAGRYDVVGTLRGGVRCNEPQARWSQ
jgi:hypothetical protein